MRIEIDLYKDLNDSDLHISDVVILKTIKKMCIDNGGECDLSNSEMCDLFKLTFPTIQKIILKLEKLKYVIVDFKRNNKNKRIIKLCLTKEELH